MYWKNFIQCLYHAGVSPNRVLINPLATSPRRKPGSRRPQKISLPAQAPDPDPRLAEMMKRTVQELFQQPAKQPRTGCIEVSHDWRKAISFPAPRWLTIGLCIMLVVLAFNMIGDGLRDALDPRLRGTL